MFNVDAPRPNLSFLHNVGGKKNYTPEKGVDGCAVFVSSDGVKKRQLGTILQCNEQPVGNTGSNISEISGDKRSATSIAPESVWTMKMSVWPGTLLPPQSHLRLKFPFSPLPLWRPKMERKVGKTRENRGN